MSIIDDVVTRVSPDAITWSKVDTDFYVASRAGEYVGSVDGTVDGHFIGFDATSTPIGRYADLKEAQRAVAEWEPEEVRENDRHLARVLMPIATAAGLVAGVTAVTGMLVAAA